MNTDTKKQLILHAPCKTLAEFKPLADEAARLKEHGEVTMVVSCQHAVPHHEASKGSGWHAYAITSPGLHRFFPHETLKPHMNMPFVEKNRELIVQKASYLDSLGMKAAWWGVEPHYFPQSFFEEYPELRGPRCDHPRRSMREEFSICPDTAGGQEVISGMTKELRECVPNLGAFIFKTNDAGATLCWANAGYDGRNGPAACEFLSPGEHLANYVTAVHEGLKQGGDDALVIVGHSNFWGNEIFDHQRCLPENTLLTGLLDNSCMGLGSCDSYPIRGMIDPLGVIQSSSAWHRPEKKFVFMGFRASYDRGNETPETVGEVTTLLEKTINAAPGNKFAQLTLLREASESWAGEGGADKLFDTLYSFHHALRQLTAVASRFSVLYSGGSCRHLTRPMVFNPELLTPEEEQSFLPYVFNIHLKEARNDFIDQHGVRISGIAGGEFNSPQVAGVLGSLLAAAKSLEGLKDAPAGAWLFKLGTSVRIYYHTMRSIANQYFGQKVRDYHADVLTREDYVPEKTGSTTGEGMVLRWKELLRDEYDNTAELIKLLEQRGLEQFAHVTDAADQDSMSFPAHIVDDLKKKNKVMRDHWLDVEKYLAPPAK